MVYIYVCKRFKCTMDMVSGRDGDWVNNLLQFYCKHRKISGKLERAEINVKKRTSAISFDSSTDLFKINIVYKDSKGSEHELKWIIKVTRSDENDVADALLRHEKQVFARLMGDLANVVRQRGASRLEGSRISSNDLLPTPQFIFEEATHQADLVRNVLVLDNLDEKAFFPPRPGAVNLVHFRMVIKALAKFHAVSLTYKQMLFASFNSQVAQAKASRQIDEVVMEADNRVLTGRLGLLGRFPFLAARQTTLAFLIQNREKFMDMFTAFLECFPAEDHLVDIFHYIRLSADHILGLEENLNDPEVEDHPLDAITLGVLEARSFLFRYEDDEDKENEKKKKNSKLQRSQSERVKDKSTYDAIRLARMQSREPGSGGHGQGQGKGGGKAAPAKCPKLDQGSGLMKNKFLQNVIGKSKDDEKVPLTLKRGAKIQPPRDPNQPPKQVAFVNAKYVTYGRITRDLSILYWTAASSLVRRFYLIKLLECYVETLGITLGQLGVDTDSFGLKFLDVVRDFQQHMLHGFLISVLMAMAATSTQELELLRKSGGEPMEVEEVNGTSGETRFQPLCRERINYLRDLMRDIGAYIESKDFELGLPVTNFQRYHELWSMDEDDDEDDDDDTDGMLESEEEEEDESDEA